MPTTRRETYKCSLGVTSQFYYCGLPLRLDSYSQCTFRCTYCFAAARGGKSRRRPLQVIDPTALQRRLERVQRGAIHGVIDEFLAQKQPLHFGGMSDPFPFVEARYGLTRATLRLLGRLRYPTIISTKGVQIAQEPYLGLLKDGTFMVQFSLSSYDDDLMRRVDLGAPSPSDRFRAMEKLAALGIPVTCRIQPLLPGREKDAFRLMELCAAAGARHVATEHLKLPIERKWTGTAMLSRALGRDLHAEFERTGATRVGREWVLPVQRRLPRQIALRVHAHRLGLSFAAADNDLMLMSDGDCCCSGADVLTGFSRFFRFNYLEAARRGLAGNEVRLDSLNDVWRPRGTMSRFINSRSRLPAEGGSGAGIEAYVRQNWEGSPNGCSPELYYGLAATDERDDCGALVYRFSDEARALYIDRRPSS